MRYLFFSLLLCGVMLSCTRVWADSQTTMVQVRFSVDTAHGTYTDALYYAVGSVPAQAVINAAKTARVLAWLKAVTNQVPPDELPQQALQDRLADLQAQVQLISAALDLLPIIAADSTPPSVPKNLAGIRSPTDVTLSWDPATDNVAVAGYSIFRDGALLDRVAVEKYVDFTAVSGTQYSYRVRAFDRNANVSAMSTALVMP